MVKKITILICCALTVFLYSVGDFSPIQNFYINLFKQPEETKVTKMLPEYPKGTTIHIYIEEATFPTELQLFDIVQRPKDTPKIISWNWLRFPHLNLDNYNVTELGFGFRNSLYHYNKQKVEEFIQELKNLKDNDFVIHANLYWIASIMPFLRELPKEKIKHIYLYEDGLANHLVPTPLPLIEANIPDIKQLTQMMEADGNSAHKSAYFLHKHYPVTYRISFWNEVKKKTMLNSFLELMKDADVENIDIQKIANTLTDEQKSELFKIFDFDVNFYKKIIKNKRVHFFVIGHYITYDDMDLQEWFLQHNSSDDILFIKGNSDQLYNRLIPAFSFPNQLPFEMLIIGGLTPTSVSGVASTLFYSLPKENIGKIIYEETDPHAKTIKNLLNLSDEQIKLLKVNSVDDLKSNNGFPKDNFL